MEMKMIQLSCLIYYSGASIWLIRLKKKWKLIEVAAKATIKISPMKHHKKTAFASQLKTQDINWNWYLNRWLNRLDSIALKLTIHAVNNGHFWHTKMIKMNIWIQYNIIQSFSTHIPCKNLLDMPRWNIEFIFGYRFNGTFCVPNNCRMVTHIL